MARKAIGIVRVSQVAGREGEAFASPYEQRERIRDACKRDGLKLVETIDELDVSGATPLERREGLRRAVEAVEAGEVEVIVAAYFDRLVRSLRVQDELVSRVERAGGQVLAVDVGAITNGSAGQWLSGTMLGAVSEYQRRTAAERSAEAQARAVARGVALVTKVPLGYLRGEDGVLVRDPETAPLVREAFKLRVGGASIRQIRERLDAGVPYATIQRILTNRVYLGEVHFGKLQNLDAHEPLVPRDLWQRAQRVHVPRGRQPKSDRLLARVGVLRCGGCDGRMGVSTSYNGTVPVYRCPRTTSGDCPARVTIGAEIVERIVVDAVRARIADIEGRASAEAGVREAEQTLERAQADLDAAIRTLAGFEDEVAAHERLVELRRERDAAQERVDQLGGQRASVVLSGSADWDRLSLDGRRALIRAVVDRVVVAPGRGADRATVELLGE